MPIWEFHWHLHRSSSMRFCHMSMATWWECGLPCLALRWQVLEGCGVCGVISGWAPHASYQLHCAASVVFRLNILSGLDVFLSHVNTNASAPHIPYFVSRGWVGVNLWSILLRIAFSPISRGPLGVFIWRFLCRIIWSLPHRIHMLGCWLNMPRLLSILSCPLPF